MDSLPAETVDYIISYLADDRKCLASLSLASQLLSRCGRAHYLHRITISPHNVQKLSDLLTSPHQTISKNVRRAVIDGNLQESSSNFLTIHLPPIASIIGNAINTISLVRFDFASRSLSPDLFQQLFSRFTAIKSLEISQAAFSSVSQTMSILSNFRGLETLSLKSVIWQLPSYDADDDDPASAVYSYDIPMSLRKLSLAECYKKDILGCFLSQASPVLVRDLDLGSVYSGEAQAVGKCVSVLGPNLRSLSLGFSPLSAGEDAENFYYNCDLGSIVNLQSIHFHRFIDWQHYFSDPWPCFSKIILSLRSRILTRISLSVELPQQSPLSTFEDLHWSELDQLFAQQVTTTLPGLACIQLCLCVWVGHEAVYIPRAIQIIKRNLPLCNEKELLQFVSSTYSMI